MNVPVIVTGAVICMFLGTIIGGTKGLGGFGAIVGLLLGPLGLLIVLISKPTPAVAAAREEAIETERAKLRAQREGAQGTASPPADS